MSLIIKEVAKKIRCELDVAEDYIDSALEHMDKYYDLSARYYEITTDELEHVNELHKEVIKLISEHEKIKDVSDDTLKIMKSIWEFEHSDFIDRVAMIQTKMKLFEDYLK